MAKKRSRNPIIRFESWLDETAPALEHIMFRVGSLVVYAAGLVALVVLALRQS